MCSSDEESCGCVGRERVSYQSSLDKAIREVQPLGVHGERPFSSGGCSLKKVEMSSAEVVINYLCWRVLLGETDRQSRLECEEVVPQFELAGNCQMVWVC